MPSLIDLLDDTKSSIFLQLNLAKSALWSDFLTKDNPGSNMHALKNEPPTKETLEKYRSFLDEALKPLHLKSDNVFFDSNNNLSYEVTTEKTNT